MNKKKSFQCVFKQTLDNGDESFIKKCAKWGLDTLKTLEQNGRVVVAVGGEHGNNFIYAVTTAVIVGEFGFLAFNNYFLNEIEIDLERTGLVFDDVEIYIDDTVPNKRREELRKGNFVNLQDIWSTVQEWKQEINHSLIDIYKRQDKWNPIDYIFTHIEDIFDQKDDRMDRRLSSYLYVEQGFQY